jgi:hypothetical protein
MTIVEKINSDTVLSINEIEQTKTKHMYAYFSAMKVKIFSVWSS